MIEAIQRGQAGAGVSRANAICDECRKIETVTCDYERVGQEWRPKEGQVIRKMEGKGWSLVKGTMRCIGCEAKRKAMNATKPKPAHAPTARSEVEPPREPSRRMVATIMGMLDDAYDVTAKRYKNPADNDRSIADVIGDGCLWGWVARIREEEFGPDTRSKEIEAIRAEIKAADEKASKAAKDAAGAMDALTALRARLDAVVS